MNWNLVRRDIATLLIILDVLIHLAILMALGSDIWVSVYNRNRINQSMAEQAEILAALGTRDGWRREVTLTLERIEARACQGAAPTPAPTP